jgi:hypothetical protein
VPEANQLVLSQAWSPFMTRYLQTKNSSMRNISLLQPASHLRILRGCHLLLGGGR